MKIATYLILGLSALLTSAAAQNKNLIVPKVPVRLHGPVTNYPTVPSTSSVSITEDQNTKPQNLMGTGIL